MEDCRFGCSLLLSHRAGVKIQIMSLAARSGSGIFWMKSPRIGRTEKRFVYLVACLSIDLVVYCLLVFLLSIWLSWVVHLWASCQEHGSELLESPVHTEEKHRLAEELAEDIIANSDDAWKNISFLFRITEISKLTLVHPRHIVYATFLHLRWLLQISISGTSSNLLTLWQNIWILGYWQMRRLHHMNQYTF